MTSHPLTALINVAARIMIATIFLLSAVGNKIPNFMEVANYMAAKGVPWAPGMLVGAILFLVAGSLSIIVGYRARWGAGLLLAFLTLATYYFHDFWNLQGQAQQDEMIQFLKNLSLMGTMLFVIANGAGPASLDARAAKAT